MPFLLTSLGLEKFLYPARSPSRYRQPLSTTQRPETWICEQLLRRLRRIRGHPVTYEGLSHLKRSVSNV